MFHFLCTCLYPNLSTVFFPATLDQQGVATDDFQTSVLSGKLLYYVYTSIVEPIWKYSVAFFLI